MHACRHGHLDVVKLLTGHPNRKIDLNARDYDGRTAQLTAGIFGHQDIAKLLFDHPNRNRPIKRRKL